MIDKVIRSMLIMFNNKKVFPNINDINTVFFKVFLCFNMYHRHTVVAA